KPTYGLVSTRGILPLSWSLDHVGPMARTVSDTALILQAIAYYDPKDFYCQKFPPVYYPSAIEENISGLRLAVASEFFNEIDPEIKQLVDAAALALGRLTAGVQEISLTTSVDRTVVICEPYAYHQKYLPDHEAKYHPETVRRLRAGAEVSASQYIDAYREMLRQRRAVLEIFEQVDLIITPTSPVQP